MDREQLDQSYTKDKHSSVRILFQETSAVGETNRSPEGRNAASGTVFCAVIALYIMDLNILCVDARVFVDSSVAPAGLKDIEKRVLETHDFPSAVRRSVALTDEIKNEMRAKVYELLGEAKFTPT